MTILKKVFLLLFLFIAFSCKSVKEVRLANQYIANEEIEKIKKSPSKTNSFISFEDNIDTTFVNLKNYSNDFVLDIKYATSDNFLNEKVYDCAACYLRLKTVKSLINANKDFIEKGYRIKIFDCYRPLDVQKRMWEIVSNPDYVADPSKGSIHNRGGAVDITLVDSNGNDIDMGTSFDFFGVEASHDYQNLSEEVKNNRKLLKEVMLKNNFKSFDSEWWHYNLKDSNLDNLSNFKWKCD
ncbi:M15 family metallopeptidase [Flavobacterium sp.]|uniref:M15 family metallopeptidase n=1 Tax=Flavobacterium sp. TaxID=239 RepID=UPI00261A6EBB|nr:M15 family metallopeptidase [Flavobacterium sp.]